MATEKNQISDKYDSEIINADDFYTHSVNKPRYLDVISDEEIRNYLLDKAKAFSVKSIQDAYYYGTNSTIIIKNDDNPKKFIRITLCKYGYFGKEDLTQVGRCIEWFSIVQNPLFPVADFKAWLKNYGWNLDGHRKKCANNEVWLELVSKKLK